MRTVAVIFFLFIVLIACSNKAVQLDDRIEMKIDSIYVNEAEKSDTIRHEPFIVYYCDIKNLHDSTINVQIKDYLSEGEFEGNFYLINSKDTLSLFLATNKSIQVPPKEEFHFGLATNTFGMVDLLEKYGYSIEHHSKPNKLNEVEFLKKIARESFILFEWRGHKKEIRGLEKVKINYRNPNDSTVE